MFIISFKKNPPSQEGGFFLKVSLGNGGFLPCPYFSNSFIWQGLTGEV